MTLCQPKSSFKNFKMVSLILYITICGSFIHTCLLDIYCTLRSILLRAICGKPSGKKSPMMRATRK